MAKKAAKAATPANPLKGKKVAFVGKVGYGTYWTDRYKEWAALRGATVVAPTADMDVLVYGAGRGGKPPGDVAKIEKRLPAVETMDEKEFCTAALPDANDLVEGLLTGPERGREFWNTLLQIATVCRVTLDLSGYDLRKAKLAGALFQGIPLTGTDFRDADLTGAVLNAFGRVGVSGARFDGACLNGTSLGSFTDCSFRKARMGDIFWMYYGTFTRCDFRNAEMLRFPGQRAKFVDCDFRGADLTGAFLRDTTVSGCDFGGTTMAYLHGHGTKFTDCKFGKANLTRAQLIGASLKNADLRGADLTNAVLVDADMTGAQVAGANFDGAVLAGAKIAGVDFSKAKNYTLPVARKPGPVLKAFEEAVKKARGFRHTTARAEIGPGEVAVLEVHASGKQLRAASEYQHAGETAHDGFDCKSMAAAMLRLAERWPNVTLRQDAITVQGKKGPADAKLLSLAVAAWAEAFGVAPLTADELADQQKKADADAIRLRDQWVAKFRKGHGSAAWNNLDYKDRDRIDLQGIDLSGIDAHGVILTGRNLSGCNFSNAVLTDAALWGSDFRTADLSGAKLNGADLSAADCAGALFAKADLTDADLTGAKLQGVDLSTAILAGCTLVKAQYDDHTKFPVGFEVPLQMTWKGTGPRTGVALKSAAAGTMDFDTFFKGLGGKVDSGRITNATKMLKAERFQLFSDVTDTQLVGIVKSQSSDSRVYSCRLASDGGFSCGTQNLRPCGGLQGSLCKHLMVLVIGLAKAGKLDPAVADNWVNASKGHQPAWDDATKDAMSETFLKYKGVEAGEIDWRPTETIPEDYYAM